MTDQAAIEAAKRILMDNGVGFASYTEYEDAVPIVARALLDAKDDNYETTEALKKCHAAWLTEGKRADALAAELKDVQARALELKGEIDLAWDTVQMQKRRAEKAEAQLDCAAPEGANCTLRLLCRRHWMEFAQEADHDRKKIELDFAQVKSELAALRERLEGCDDHNDALGCVEENLRAVKEHLVKTEKELSAERDDLRAKLAAAVEEIRKRPMECGPAEHILARHGLTDGALPRTRGLPAICPACGNGEDGHSYSEFGRICKPRVS